MTDEDEYYMVERIGNVAKRMEDFLAFFHASSELFRKYASCAKNVKGQHIYLDNGMENSSFPEKTENMETGADCLAVGTAGAPERMMEMNYVLYCIFSDH